MLYAAARAAHPEVAFVRVALPLTAVAQQLRRVGVGALAGVRAGRTGRDRARVVVLGPSEPARGEDRRGRAPLRRGRPDAPVLRLRGRRARRRGARPRLVRAGAGPPDRGAVARPGTDGGHPLGDGRRRARRRPPGAAAAGQPRRAGHAARRRGGGWPALPRGHPAPRHRVAAGDRAPRRRASTAASWRSCAIRAGRSSPAPQPVASAGGGGAVLVLHDITDLRRADQIRRDFVANVSHELRTPLTAIRGYVEALLDEEPDDGDDAGVSRDHRASQHAHGAAGPGSPAPRAARRAPGSPRNDRVRRAADLRRRRHRPGAGHRGQAPAASRPPSSPMRCILQADPAKLHDILRNLVENAVNYSPEDAAIHLAASRRDGVARHHGRRLRSGHPAGGSDAGVRALLPRGQVAFAARRHRAGAGDRQAPGRTARRQGDRGKPAERRRRVHRHASNSRWLVFRGRTDGHAARAFTAREADRKGPPRIGGLEPEARGPVRTCT